MVIALAQYQKRKEKKKKESDIGTVLLTRPQILLSFHLYSSRCACVVLCTVILCITHVTGYYTKDFLMLSLHILTTPSILIPWKPLIWSWFLCLCHFNNVMYMNLHTKWDFEIDFLHWTQCPWDSSRLLCVPTIVLVFFSF